MNLTGIVCFSNYLLFLLQFIFGDIIFFLLNNRLHFESHNSDIPSADSTLRYSSRELFHGKLTFVKMQSSAQPQMFMEVLHFLEKDTVICISMTIKYVKIFQIPPQGNAGPIKPCQIFRRSNNTPSLIFFYSNLETYPLKLSKIWIILIWNRLYEFSTGLLMQSKKSRRRQKYYNLVK